MKKIVLSRRLFAGAKVLSRNELKKIMGGNTAEQNLEQEGGCSTGVCSDIVEDYCCEGLKCVVASGAKLK